MIGFGVKACFCAFAVMAAVGCSSKAVVGNDARVGHGSVPTGAEQWQGGAMLLPAGSPAVFSGRLDQLLDAATRFKAWLVAEPAMLGADGPRIARSIETGWGAATAYLGVDPLLPRAWTERGLDPSRRLYVGMYPVHKDGRRFITSVETVIREEVGLAPGGHVSRALQTLAASGGQLPEGTHARILRNLEETSPVGGLRVVLPITSAREFSTTASSFAEGMGFRRFGREHGGDETTTRFWAEGDVTAMSLRVEGEFAVIDLVFPRFAGGPRTTLDPQLDLAGTSADLDRALEEMPVGRPRAPAPPGAPAASVSFDQAGMHELVRLRGYWNSLEDLRSIGADRRDVELLGALVSAVSEADVWTVAADELTGTSFQLTVEPSGTRSLGTVQMTMYARRGLDPLDTSRELPTLDLSQRSASVGVDLATLRTPTWRSWFIGETAAEFNALEFTSMRPMHTLLPGLRAGTLALSNLGDSQSGAAVSRPLATALREFAHVARFEVVGLAPDVTQLQQRPEILCAVVLNPDAPPSAVADIQRAVGAALLEWAEPSAAQPVFASLAPGVTSTVAMGSLAIRQHLIEGPEHRVILFGVGVDDAQFDREIGPLGASRPLHGVFQARLEPIALLSWLREGDAALFDPVDVDILAQRLGALTLSYQSARIAESSAMTLELRLDPPPRL